MRKIGFYLYLGPVFADELGMMAERILNRALALFFVTSLMAFASGCKNAEVYTTGNFSMYASISGIPDPLNNLTNHTIYVSGAGVQTYRYKFGPTESCATEAGYSADYSSSTPIYLVTSTDGNYILCIETQDFMGNWQTAADSISASWERDATAPTLSLSYPMTGYLKGGSVMAPSWSTSDLNFGSSPIKIEYTIDAGSNWSFVAYDSANPSIAWTVPSIDTSSLVLRLTSTDLLGQSVLSSSSYIVVDSTAPAVTAVSVNSGAKVKGGSSVGINWTAADTNMSTAPISIDYSIDSGATWLNIATNVVNSGTYSWPAPTTSYTGVLVRVSATDKVGHSSSANSPSFDIDATAPTVSSVVAVSPDGTYKPDDVVIIQINFSENVNVTGTPTLQLNSALTPPVSSYISGSGTSSLLFSYPVANGQNASALDYASATALALSGGFIKDAVGHSASLTLPTPGEPNSLGANSDIVIDGLARLEFSVSSVSVTSFDFGNVPTYEVKSQVIKVTNTGGGVAGSMSSSALAAPFQFVGGSYPGSGGNCANTLMPGGICEIKVAYSPWIENADSDTVTLQYDDGASVQVAMLPLNGAGVARAKVIGITSSLGSSSVSYEAASAQTIEIYLTFDRVVSVDTASGLPSIFLNTTEYPGKEIFYTGGSGGDTLTFQYITVAPDHTPDPLRLDIVAYSSINNYSLITDDGGYSIDYLPLPTDVDPGSLASNSDIAIYTIFSAWDPLNKATPIMVTSDSNGTPNLTTYKSSNNTDTAILATLGKTTGKWYFEIRADTLTGLSLLGTNIGIGTDSSNLNGFVGGDSQSIGYDLSGAGVFQGGTGSGSYSTVYLYDTIGVAVDLDNHKIWFSVNGTWQGQDPNSASTGFNLPLLSGSDAYHPMLSMQKSGSQFSANFGQHYFYYLYSVPTGFNLGWY